MALAACRDGKTQRQSPTTAGIRRNSGAGGIWQSSRQEQWVIGNSLIIETSGVQQQEQESISSQEKLEDKYCFMMSK